MPRIKIVMKYIRHNLALVPVFFVFTCAHQELSEQEALQLKQAVTEYREQKFDQAETTLTELGKKFPANIEINVLRARIKYYTRDFAASESILRDLLKKREGNAHASIWLGRVVAVSPKRTEEERLNEASSIFKQVLKDDPENFQAHYLLGRCLEAQGKLELALYEYQAAEIPLEDQAQRINAHLGDLFTRLNMTDRAAKHRKMAGALAGSQEK
ncbi:MAG TPA: tetratricopeptide repeat protein [Leptospiraceae bacterium]|nr:tetratricopeptide repeat protein [Leptospiraceae bacterium]